MAESILLVCESVRREECDSVRQEELDGLFVIVYVLLRMGVLYKLWSGRGDSP